MEMGDPHSCCITFPVFLPFSKFCLYCLTMYKDGRLGNKSLGFLLVISSLGLGRSLEIGVAMYLSNSKVFRILGLGEYLFGNHHHGFHKPVDC